MAALGIIGNDDGMKVTEEDINITLNQLENLQQKVICFSSVCYSYCDDMFLGIVSFSCNIICWNCTFILFTSLLCVVDFLMCNRFFMLC